MKSNFPSIKRAEAFDFVAGIDNFVKREDVVKERCSRAVWARKLAEKLMKGFQNEKEAVCRELLRVAEADEK